MILTIVIATVVLMLTAGSIFLLARYLPIVANLFMNVTVRPVPEVETRFEGEDVTFETTDGVKLAGTLSPPSPNHLNAPLILFCPEYSASRHSATKYATFLIEAGYRVFSFDFRAHGDSERPEGYTPLQWITELEVIDVRAALRYLKSRSDLPTRRIGLFGISRGAVTALVAAATDKNIAGIVSDGAFSTQYTLHGYMRRWAPIFVDPRMLLLSAPDYIFAIFRRLAVMLAEHRLDVRFVPLESFLKRLKIPILFLHGEKDNYIDASQAKLLYDLARGRKELWVVPGADHNEAVDVAPAEYHRRILRFFQSIFPEGASERKVRDGKEEVSSRSQAGG